MKRIVGTLLAGALMAVLLTIAAPTPDVHADPNPICSVVGLGDNSLCNGVVGNVLPATQAAPAAQQVWDFVKSPISYIGAAVMGAATFVLTQVASLANASTAPDLSLDFWKSAYAKAWSIALVLFCFIALWEFGNLALRRITPSQFGATLTLWMPCALGAMMFGPMFAQVLINGSTYLADGLIHSMSGFSGADSFNAIDKSIQSSNIFGSGTQGPIQGMLSIVFGLFMLIAAIMVYLSLAFQGLVMYLSTAAFAIAAAWLASTGTRKHTFSYARMFVGVCFAKLTVIFVLGVVLAMATAATAITGDGVSKDFALIVMAIIGMGFAALVPLFLLRHTPVMPGMASAVGIGMAGVGAAAAWTVGSAGARAAGSRAAAGGSKLGGATKSGSSQVAGMVARKGRKAPMDQRLNQAAQSNRTIDPPTPGGSGGRVGDGASAGAAAASDARRLIDPPVPPPADGAGGPKLNGSAKKVAPKPASFAVDTSTPGWQTKIPWTDGKRADHPMHSGSKLNGAVTRTPPRTPPPAGDKT